MSQGAAATGAQRAASLVRRAVRAFRVLPHEERLAVYGSLGLFVTLFLPWYQEHFFIVVSGRLQPAADTLTAWGAFSFVEAAVLLVAGGVLTLLFQRAEGRAFHLPGGDGWVIMAAGFWTCVLIIWRIFDKQGATSSAQNATSSGIQWGIFVALAVAGFLAYAGSRIRGAHVPEPPLPGEEPGAVARAAPGPRRPPRGAPADERPVPRRARPPVSADEPARRDEQLTIPFDPGPGER